VLVIFFVAVGSSLRLEALTTVGAVAVALVAVRLALIRLGTAAGIKVSGIDSATGRYVWTGLISQAGITLGLTALIASEFPTWGSQVQLLVVALIVVHELVGPVLFRNGLMRAGELDATAPRPLVVVSNREPYLHNYDAGRRHQLLICDRRSSGCAGCADARTWRQSGLLTEPAPPTAKWSIVRQSARAAAGPGISTPAAVARGEAVRRILRWIRERRTLAIVPPCGCAAHVSAGGLGSATRASMRSSRLLSTRN
jgi:hypothetical protein